MPVPPPVSELFAKLKVHRRMLLDLVLLWCAFSVTERYWFDGQLTWWPRLLGLAVVILAPNWDGKITDSPAIAYARRLAVQIFVCVVTDVSWHFFFSLPSASFTYAAFWLPASAAFNTVNFSVYPRLLKTIAARASVHRDDIVLGEVLLIALVLFAGQSLVPGLWPVKLVIIALAAWAVASRSLGLAKQSPRLHFFAAVGVLLISLAVGIPLAGGSWQPAQLPSLIWLGLVLILYRWRLDHSSRRDGIAEGGASENLRWLVLLGSGWLLLHPFLRPSVHGTGDSLWYATMLADMMAQVRSGEFPVFVGQSIYQFNGAIYPLRVSPAFHHAGALVDLLTGFTLGPVPVLNALIFSTGFLALGISYLCLRALLPTARWVACALAVLFVSCPGTLGIAFNTDLFMSWMTVPWLPLALYGSVKSFHRSEPRGLFALAGGLGLMWWGHAPIALWTTVLAALIQIVRLVSTRPSLLSLRVLAGSAALFAAIVAYPVGSVLFFPPEPGINAAGFQEALASTIVRFLRSVRPAVWLPLSPSGRLLSDFQIGYALWAGLILSLWLLVRRRSVALLALPLTAAALALLLNLPTGPDEILWRLIPAFVRNISGNWVMNRLYLVQAGFIVFGLAALVPAFRESGVRVWRILTILLVGGALWSVVEAGKFAYGSRLGTRPPESGAQAMLPENVQITRFAYLVFPKLPAYFTHGVTEPALEQRLFRTTDDTPLSDNFSAAARGRELGVFEPTAALPTDGGVFSYPHPLRLLPDHHYVVSLDFSASAPPQGIFQIKGATTLREYALPEYGEATSFGYGGAHTQILALPNHTGQPQDVDLRFFPQLTPGTTAFPLSFARLRWIEYDPATLPVRVESWIPYRARVTASEAAWLETPRMFQTPYVASVDGRPTPVRKSPQGLVSIAVPAGESVVELRYVAPLGLQALYWVSLLAGVGVVVTAASGWFWKNPALERLAD